jgi:phosphoribosylaminoimidazole carboxylase
MLASVASLLNVPVVIPDAPAKQVLQPPTLNLEHVDGSFADPTKIKELAEKVDVLTVDIEHVDAAALEQLETTLRSSSKKLDIHPSPRTIGIIQDKFLQKHHLSRFQNFFLLIASRPERLWKKP